MVSNIFFIGYPHFMTINLFFFSERHFLERIHLCWFIFENKIWGILFLGKPTILFIFVTYIKHRYRWSIDEKKEGSTYLSFMVHIPTCKFTIVCILQWTFFNYQSHESVNNEISSPGIIWSVTIVAIYKDKLVLQRSISGYKWPVNSIQLYIIVIDL